MSRALVPNRTASIARPRIEDDLLRLAQAWKSDARGPVYIQALSGWLSSHKSPNTARAYRFALTEFADWYEMKRAKVFLPHLVTTTDANLFAQYLMTRTEGMEELHLKRADRLLELAVYRAVKKRAGSNIDQIRAAIMGQMGVETALVTRDGQQQTVLACEKSDFYGFDKLLAKMVDQKLLARTPSIRELRVKDKTIGFRTRPDPMLFSYFPPQQSRYAPGERASTLDARLSALSSFWRYMVERGENLPGYEQPVKVNIWAPLKRDYASRAREQKRLARAATSTQKSTFDRLMQTTEGSRKLSDIRDRAALLMFYWTGIRADELGRAKRADVSWPAEAGRAAVIRVLGKGQKLRQFRIPPVAFQSLVDLSVKLDELAKAEEHRDEGALPRARILLSGDAPLLPSLDRWGLNSVRKGDWNEETLISNLKVGVSRGGWAMMLQSLAERAGIRRGTEEFRQVHPHGLRHLAGREAIARGVPVPTVQATFGHASLTTTGAYAEVYDPGIIGLDMAPGAAATALAAAPAPAVVVATTAAPEPPPEEASVEQMAAQGPLWAYTSEGAEGRQQLTSGRADPDLPALATVRVGASSRLPWWSGPANHLSPAMPVIAPQQVWGTWPERDVVMRSLSELYGSWLLSRGEHGATSAAALVWWVNEALEVTEQADEFLLEHDARWFPFPTSDEAPEYDANGLRGHDPEFVVDWFRAHGWKYTKTMKTMQVDDAPSPAPAWFKDDDPIRSLPDEERAEALAWLRGVTGELQAGTSEADRELLLETLLEMSRVADEPARERSTADTRYLSTLATQAAKVLEDAGVQVGGGAGVLKLDAQRRDRTAAARAGAGDATGTRKAFWMQYVRKAFPESRERIEPVLVDYRDLLRVDSGAQTIVHDDDFRSDFARTVGGHSECVARRIARYLWELRKLDVAARVAGTKRPRAAERPDDLIRDVQAMRYLLAPCAPSQEAELAERIEKLGDSARSITAAQQRHAAILERQREVAKKLKQGARPQIREAEVAAELKQAEREGARLGGIGQGDGMHLVPNARTMVRMVPSPIALLFAVRS